MANVSNTSIGLSSGEPTASGVEWCKSRGVWEVYYPGKSVVKSTARSRRRNPSTLLEGGLALDLGGDGKWIDHTNASGTAKGILDTSHGMNVLDGDGVGQDVEHAKIMVCGMYDKAQVFDGQGVAIDAAGIANLGDSPGTNGCCLLAMAT